MTTLLHGTAADAGAARLVAWLERGELDGLFAPDVFADLSFPHWRVQLEGVDEVVRLKNEMHPPGGTTHVERLLRSERGYVLQVEERWEREGQQWYCREVFLCDLDAEGRIVEMGYHCTGQWDEARVAEHAEVVTLVRA